MTNYARVGKNLKGKKSRFPFRFREKNSVSVVASASDGVVGRRKRDLTTVVVVDAAFDFLNDSVLYRRQVYGGLAVQLLALAAGHGISFFPLATECPGKKDFRRQSVSQ